VLVQIGTPEEIVTEPADDYVAEFVAGISKLDLVTAARIMQPFAQFARAEGPQDTAAWPVAAPEDKLNTLVDLAVGTDHPILIRAEGRNVGVVTKRALLRGIQGREEAARPQRETA
jgi:glycine betaine/proline transport system ATP-binding protein